MFNFIKSNFTKIYQAITSPFQALFASPTIDQNTINQLQELLLKADTGVATTKKIIAHLQHAYSQGQVTQGAQLQAMLCTELEKLLITQKQTPSNTAKIFLMVGINGSGKTTFVAKLANYFKLQNRSCVIAAADTFRAAASTQLQTWATHAGAQIITGKTDQDPASIVFDACQTFTKTNADALIIDTAGRLQNKENLMQELAKIKRIISKQLPNHQICTLLTIDAMLGQNSFDQARLFNDTAQVDGIVLTKMDGSAKGGIVFSITQELQIPVAFLSWGEKITDMAPFDPKAYVQNLLAIKTNKLI